ncbi:hypothetical protein CNYM01_13660 [Colletotrichum nymphaeae SA-01]|uniref:Uncharacterized protein n=1 Tax=Colletotrichum nymphaeae SA-01 TaxID=1460502 RepID=A0A135TH41_9PEZI|nr:hypothetical protein CNYM01_13660 [Colletotrichum nymphaeae SA-01]
MVNSVRDPYLEYSRPVLQVSIERKARAPPITEPGPLNGGGEEERTQTRTRPTLEEARTKLKLVFPPNLTLVFSAKHPSRQKIQPTISTTSHPATDALVEQIERISRGHFSNWKTRTR